MLKCHFSYTQLGTLLTALSSTWDRGVVTTTDTSKKLRGKELTAPKHSKKQGYSERESERKDRKKNLFSQTAPNSMRELIVAHFTATTSHTPNFQFFTFKIFTYIPIWVITRCFIHSMSKSSNSQKRVSFTQSPAFLVSSLTHGSAHKNKKNFFSCPSPFKAYSMPLQKASL